MIEGIITDFGTYFGWRVGYLDFCSEAESITARNFVVEVAHLVRFCSRELTTSKVLHNG